MHAALGAQSLRSADDRGRHSHARAQDGRRESTLGCASDPRRVGQVGRGDIGADRLAAPAATASAALTDLAHVSDDHVAALASIDFFTVPTITGRILFVFVVLTHDRRRIAHFNVTPHPTAAWTAQQMIDAFPDDSAPGWLLRDRDAIYGQAFRRRVAGMGIREVLSRPSSPCQNPYVERLIGSIRRECLDHVIVLGERHLRRMLAAYVAYYHGSRTHLSLEKDVPTTRRVQDVSEGAVIAFPEVGGLHHRYERRAA
jgi:putative transposase